MLKRFIPGLVVLGLITAPFTVKAADPKAAAPDVVIRLQSIDGLLEHAKLIAKLADMEEQANQLEKTYKSRLGDKGFDGIDTKRPLGLYGSITPEPQKSPAVILIPVTDSAAFLNLLERVNSKAEMGKDGVYSIKNPDLPVPVYFRFANKYVYLSPDITGDGAPEALAKNKLLDPASLLALDPTSVISASVHIDKIPDNLKQNAIQQIELRVADMKDMKEPNETEVQHKLKGVLLDAISNEMIGVIKQGGEVAVRIDIDAKSNDLKVELSLAGKPNSKLAARISKQANEKSLFGGLAGRDSALSMVIHGFYPETVGKAFGPLLLEGMREGVKKETNPTNRELGTKLIKALEPELTSLGDMDSAVDVRGPSANKLYTVVAGQKVKDGKALQEGLLDAVKSLPPEAQAMIKLDAEKAGIVSIHRIDLQKRNDPEYKRVFGDNPAYVAFRSDALFAAAGENSLDALKKALAAQPKAAPAIKVDASVTRLGPLDKNFTGFPKAGLEALAKEKDGDKIRLTLEGGQALKLRLDAKLTLVRLIAEIQKAQGK